MWSGSAFDFAVWGTHLEACPIFLKCQIYNLRHFCYLTLNGQRILQCCENANAELWSPFRSFPEHIITLCSTHARLIIKCIYNHSLVLEPEKCCLMFSTWNPPRGPAAPRWESLGGVGNAWCTIQSGITICMFNWSGADRLKRVSQAYSTSATLQSHWGVV